MDRAQPVGRSRGSSLGALLQRQCDSFKTVLPQLIQGAASDEERVFIVESPLSELIDQTIALHREPDWPDQVVVDERYRAFFEAIKLSLARQWPRSIIARIDVRKARHKVMTAAPLINQHEND